MKTKQPHALKMSILAGLAASLMLLIAAPGYAANVLNTVSVAEGPNESQVIKIVMQDPVETMPVSFTTSNPHRLVLDFANTSNSIGRVQEALNSGAIKNYQVVQAGDRTRVVFNLNTPSSHELRKDRNLVLIVLHSAPKQAGAPTPASAPARFAEVGKQREYGIRDVDFRRGKNGEGRIAISLTDPGVGIDIQQKGRTIQVDFLNTSLPTALQRRLDVADFATPTQLIETFEQGKNTRMVVTPKGKWDYSAHQTGNQFVMEVRSLDDPNLAKNEKPQYSGEKLTLNFQNVEVRSVLQVIADFTSLNIIASDTVTGNVTLRLKDVPWDQALDIILRAKGLDKRVSGSVIWVAPRDELAAKEKLELEAKKSIADLEALTTRSYRLNYLRADEAMAVLSGDSRSINANQEAATCSPSSTGIKADVAAGGSSGSSSTTSASGTTTSNKVNRVLSDRGGASHDLTTNTLVVTDTLERHTAIEEVLKNVDLPSKQVMIEARIVLADDTFSRDIGAKLGIRSNVTRGGTSGAISANQVDSNLLATGGTSTNPLNINLPANPASGTAGSIGFTILNAAANTLLSLELQALEADNRGKIVSNPRVVTTNLRPAVILQGTQIPYQTVASAGVSTTSFKDALLCLLVSPQVLNNDSIILNVEVTKDAQGVNTTAGPAINVKRVKTQVRINNGETAVLGGIFEQTLRNDTNKVPFLGDIPILGNLFKNTSKSDTKSEMLIFLTPRVLDDTLNNIR
ncbi:MAG: type IV pilus secretin PilQ [Pseudomonadota bacterium]|nr:type IV pilus secretin PilQ [Pseudomonadota bacterium]